MVSFALNDKIALITGASRGIGESVALELARRGALCVLVSRKIEGLQAVQKKIIDAGGKAEAIACHMGDMTQIDALFKTIESQYGRLDILVNNAATNPYFGALADAPEWAYDKTFEVNLKGPFFMIQKAVVLMEKSGAGSIVNVASINGISPGPMQGVYSMTKAALISMTKAWAQELAARNIRVNALLPGLTKTHFAGALIENDEIYQHAITRIPMHRHATPDEMAGAVLYFVSEASSFTTGTTLVCDGGSLI